MQRNRRNGELLAAALQRRRKAPPRKRWPGSLMFNLNRRDPSMQVGFHWSGVRIKLDEGTTVARQAEMALT